MTTTRRIVMKFGGTSVEDLPAFERVAGIVQSHETTGPIVVVSAISGMTNALLACVRDAKRGDMNAALRNLAEPFERHRRIAQALNENHRMEMEELIDIVRYEINERLAFLKFEMIGPQLQDLIVSFGEDLSARLLTMILREHGVSGRYVDARRCIITNDVPGCAAPLLKQTEHCTRATLNPLVQAGHVPVISGFIGSTQKGVTTTLGRGGSDYSASLIAAAMRVREIQIWTDVTGMLSADPRVINTARTVTQLSYAEAAELAYFGAKVLHPKTIEPAVEHDIPLRICNSRTPEEFGTLVCSVPVATPRTVKAIAHKRGVTIVKITSARFLGAFGFLKQIFEIFDRHRTVVDILTTSEVSLSLSLENVSASIVQELQKIGSVEVKTDLAVVSVVGEGLCGVSSIPAMVFSSIRDIPVLLISQGSSSSNLTFVVNEEYVESVVTRLHATFFDNCTELPSEIAPVELAVIAA